MDRVTALEQLAARQFDLLIVGGGIVGAGIAEAATAHGLPVAAHVGGFSGTHTATGWPTICR